MFAIAIFPTDDPLCDKLVECVSTSRRFSLQEAGKLKLEPLEGSGRILYGSSIVVEFPPKRAAAIVRALRGAQCTDRDGVGANSESQALWYDQCVHLDVDYDTPGRTAYLAIRESIADFENDKNIEYVMAMKDEKGRFAFACDNANAVRTTCGRHGLTVADP